ncbi:type II toxin-antitoxin system VapC family toxin [Kutzneria sp. NPDC051319]|uniref:type II toxin-antitoxin system VapC family toxin n=1 Tax=Kutzneria sp. NPDC051319 TaxID=3155047 RepID=UPI003412F403
MTDIERGMLDTSVVIDIPTIPEASLPLECSISAITLAELTAGVANAQDPVKRVIRQRHLQATEASFEVLSFDPDAARAYGHIDVLVRAAGRSPRTRIADLFIAATAVANDLPLITRNPKDFVGLDSILTVVAI